MRFFAESDEQLLELLAMVEHERKIYRDVYNYKLYRNANVRMDVKFALSACCKFTLVYQ